MERRTLLFGLASFAAGAAPHALADPADCPPGTIWVRDERSQVGNVVTITPVCRRQPSPQPASSCAALQRELTVLRRQMDSDIQQAARVSEAVDEWTTWAAEKREEARKEAFHLAKEQAFDGMIHLVHAGAIKDRMITAQDAGLLNSNWKMNAIRLVRMPSAQKAAVLQRLSVARTVEQSVAALHFANRSVDAVYDGGLLKLEPEWKQAKIASVSLLQLLQVVTRENPYVSLLIADFRNTTNAATGWYAALAARNRLKQFAELEEGALGRAIERASRYVAASDRLRNNPCVA